MTATTRPPNKPKEQRFIQTAVSWESFKVIQLGCHLAQYQSEDSKLDNLGTT